MSQGPQEPQERPGGKPALVQVQKAPTSHNLDRVQLNKCRHVGQTHT